ncbi:MAG: hypothetical protein JWO94_2664 [Verrucomicrobiaceae bacterium]|nr:hypothetical protein [Verrucomicrobiaceae bacterium]
MKCLLLCLLAFTATALAHDPGISNATIELGVSPIVLRFTFAPADLLVAGMAGTDEVSLKEQAAKICEWRTTTGAAPLRILSSKVMDKTTVEFVLEAPRVAGEFHSLLLPDMPLGHRQLLVLRDHEGESFRIQMLNARSGGEVISQRDLDRTAPPAPVVVHPPDASFHVLPPGVAGCIFVLGVGAVWLCRRRRVTAGA